MYDVSLSFSFLFIALLLFSFSTRPLCILLLFLLFIFSPLLCLTFFTFLMFPFLDSPLLFPPSPFVPVFTQLDKKLLKWQTGSANILVESLANRNPHYTNYIFISLIIVWYLGVELTFQCTYTVNGVYYFNKILLTNLVEILLTPNNYFISTIDQ